MIFKEDYDVNYLYELYSDYCDRYYEEQFDTYFDSINFMLPSGYMHNNVPYFLSQFYHEYNLIERKDDVYFKFRDFLCELYSDLFHMEIVEVGGGVVPQFARALAEVSKRDIIVYDKDLSLVNNVHDNLILKDEEYKKETNITECDLIVGIQPCEGTKTIIESACENNKDFVIGLCNCVPNIEISNDQILMKKKREEYRKNLLEFAKKKLKEYKIGSLGQTNVLHIPVIYTKRK